MRKRLRKKLHRAEFREFGVLIQGKFKEIPSDEVLQSLVTYVESLGLSIGGGMDDEQFSFMVELGKTDCAAKREQFLAGVEKTAFFPVAIDFVPSELVDLWND